MTVDGCELNWNPASNSKGEGGRDSPTRRAYTDARKRHLRRQVTTICFGGGPEWPINWQHPWEIRPPPPAMSTTSTTAESSKRHAATPLDKQRAQLDKLLKDPLKPAYIPPPPKDKAIRPAREMMKNVQGSSAGAGSGEFHVYKASRRREYERLKLMEDESKKVRWCG